MIEEKIKKQIQKLLNDTDFKVLVYHKNTKLDDVLNK